MTIGFGNIAEPDCSVSAEKVVHPLMREEGLILLSSLLSKERTSGNIARSPLLRLTFRHSCQKVPPAGGIGVRGMPPASGVLTSKCDACVKRLPFRAGVLPPPGAAVPCAAEHDLSPHHTKNGHTLKYTDERNTHPSASNQASSRMPKPARPM